MARIDVNAFSMQQARKENATINYLTQIQNFWNFYYQIRKKTLFDIERKTTLTNDFNLINGL
jgi:outer membrane protein